jgi:hypothetical protein
LVVILSAILLDCIRQAGADATGNKLPGASASIGFIEE